MKNINFSQSRVVNLPVAFFKLIFFFKLKDFQMSHVNLKKIYLINSGWKNTFKREHFTLHYNFTFSLL